MTALQTTPSGGALRGRRILVVEDDHLLAQFTARALEDAGAEVIGPAGRVAEALSLVAGTPGLHAGVLDINLYGEMSFSVAEALLARGVAVLFTTGYGALVVPPHLRHIPRCDKPAEIGAIAALFRA